MKRNDLLSAAVDTTLACLMAIAGAGCLTTAFHMEADMGAVALTACVFAALAVLCARLRRGWLLLLLTALGGIWLLYELDFQSNLYSVLNRILTLYHRGYGWDIPEAILEYDDWDVTLTIQTVAAGCAVLAGFCLVKCLHPPAALAVLLPVFPCIVITDTVPSGEYLLLGILTVSLLALTHHTRRFDARQANRLTALLLIPLILAGCLLFNRFPQSDYRPPDISQGMFSLVDKLADHLPFLNKTPADTDIPYPNASATVHLSTAGPRPANNSKALEVVVSKSGALYLRGRSYMGYTGLSWEAWPETTAMERPGENYLAEGTQAIQIHAVQAQSVPYFPYYPGKALTLVNGALEGDVQDTYLYSFKPLRADWLKLWQKQYGTLTADNSTYAAMEQYTQLPTDTAYLALEHLKKAGVNEKTSIVQIVQRIGTYVQNSAGYDVNTGRMPEGATDFALWFLNSSDTGYCVHFATAATVLLRAAGIPARYVEGYLVDVTAGQITPVRSENAHAWVEYYVPNLGWVILEVTPSDGLPIIVPTEPTAPSQTTQPTEPTEPTLPNQTTQPTDPTLPTIPPDPTEPSTSTDPTEPSQTTRPTEPTEPTVPQESTVPAAPVPGDDPGTAGFDWSRLLPVLHWIATLFVLAVVAIGQWKLRLSLRRKQMAGREFVHIRRRWRYACMLARLCRHQPPKALLELLKKAKFSRNGLNERDLRQFDRYYAACIRGLKQCRWPLRLICRLIFAAW